MSNKIITLTKLINAYYSVCDNPKFLSDNRASCKEILSHRESIVNVIYHLMFDKLPYGADTTTLFMVLNNDISGKRLTAQQVILRFKVKP